MTPLNQMVHTQREMKIPAGMWVTKWLCELDIDAVEFAQRIANK